MTAQLRDRYAAVCAAAGLTAGAADMTVVFDAGQNSEDNLAYFASTGMHYVGSVPASDCADLLALPAKKRRIADRKRFGGLTAFDTRRTAYGAERRAILTHSPELHEAQALGFAGTTLAKAAKRLGELAATLARGKTRRGRDKVEAEIASITGAAWVKRVIRWELTGEQPRDLRLTWHVDEQAKAALEEEIFGKHVLITSHDDWTVADVIAGYRSQSEAEFAFRQLKDPHAVSFSPMHHWTSTTSASTCSPASWPCRSPTSCAAAPATPASTCPSPGKRLPSGVRGQASWRAGVIVLPLPTAMRYRSQKI
jgi:transposase